MLGLQIAEHVVGQHMYRAPGEDGHSIITDAQERYVPDIGRREAWYAANYTFAA